MPVQDVSAPKAQGHDWWAIGKDMIGTAIVAMLIMWPIVAWKSKITQYSLEIEPRWTLVFIILALLLATRLAMHLFVWNRAPSPVAAAARPATPAKATLSEQIGPWVFPVLVAFAVALPFIFHFERRPIDLGIYILTYIMLAWGLNIVVGLAGLLDLGYVAFYAVGAYAYALLSTVYFPYWFGDGIVPWAFYITLPVAGLLAALWGVILGFPVLRLRGDYLAIVTLAFGEIIRLVLINWFSFTNGPQGIEVPKATFFGLPFKAGPGGFADFFGIQHDRIYYYIFLYYVILLLALLTYFVTNRLRRLPIGRAWEALREDEIACRSLGINTTNTKLTAFAIGAMFGGFAGCFFATRQGFVSPESFVFIESAIILAIVVLGGLGSQIGIVFAAIAIMGSFELFRELSVFDNYLPEGTDPVHFRMLAVGLAMVLMMRFRPRGFVTRRQPTVFLKQRKAVSGDLVKEGHG
ncbi:high-affinity branched-chain amino acid ABC transporter permease LivM [Aestuariivirga sp.]|uniref:high-affinity branched-chain amino acid ABC transporter permease LivM n=1 Tax=Aestuariivirga sp. TaxID=2650926 RepID=UPI0025C3BE5B|nr:high-affinity branched-chain amino acid ABC transporter permease LivM [Aestuariivirga sp.]MCA3556125.1 high-affinity branched-chain amino acid ABC transporter permease LivM [Aestuariivirga sp.]